LSDHVTTICAVQERTLHPSQTVWENILIIENISLNFLILTSLIELNQQLSLECPYRNAMPLPQRTSISFATLIYNSKLF